MKPEQRFVIAVIVNSRSELLLLRRSADKALGGGLWGLIGGRLEPEERPQDGMARELQEELGPGHRVELLDTLGPVRDRHYGGRYEIHLFHYLWQGGEVRLNEEHTEYCWVDRKTYHGYEVMDGVDDDLAYFGIWPRDFLNPGQLTL
jgi:8-oxo-dGTP pyrophosphatase MutT (NUDIX family)